MNKNKKILLTMCMLVACLAAKAQSHWGTINEHAFNYDMSVIFTLQHGEGAEATPFAAADLDNYEFAAFIDGQLCGIGEWQTKEKDGVTHKWGYIRVYCNDASGKTVTFKYYDKNEGKEKAVFGNTGKIDFVHQALVGEPSAPHGFDMDNGVMIGDTNGDGAIDLTDASLIFRYYSEFFEDVEAMADEGLVYDNDAADVNGDGFVDLTDASLVFRYYSEFFEDVEAMLEEGLTVLIQP